MVGRLQGIAIGIKSLFALGQLSPLLFHGALLGCQHLNLLLNFLHVQQPEVFHTYWQYFTGAWVVVGMMLIGIALAGVRVLIERDYQRTNGH